MRRTFPLLVSLLCLAGNPSPSIGGPPVARLHPYEPDGDPLPQGAVVRLGSSQQYRRAFSPGSMALSPDGRLLASGTLDSGGRFGAGVRLWNVATAKEMRRLDGHERLVAALAFSPDGRTLAVADAGKVIRLWDPVTGKVLRRLRGQQKGVGCLAFAPDGKTLASASSDATVRLWDVTTGRERASYRAHQGEPLNLTFAPDGRALASLSNGGMRAWDLATGRERTFNPKGRLVGVWYSPEGRLLALRDDPPAGAYFDLQGNVLSLWDVARNKKVSAIQLPPHGNARLTLALSPDGHTLATGRHYMTGEWRMMSIHLWEVATGKLRRRFKFPGPFIEAWRSPRTAGC